MQFQKCIWLFQRLKLTFIKNSSLYQCQVESWEFFFSITLIWASEANNALSRQIVQYIDFFADDYCEIRFHEILHVFRILEKHYTFGGNIFRQICTYNSAGSHYVNSLWRLGTVCSRLLSRFYIETNTDKEKT